MSRMFRASTVLMAALIACAIGQAPAFAGVQSIADCNPDGGVLGATIGSTSASCSTADANAVAETSFTAMKAKVSVGSGGQFDSGYSARNTIEDSVTATPVDGSLMGEQGTLQFVFDIDGVLGGLDARLFFSAAQKNDESGFFSLGTPLDAAIDFSNPAGVEALFQGNQQMRYTNQTFDDITLSGQITATFDVVFGENFSYQIGHSAIAQQPDTFVDFFQTAILSDVLAFDLAGNRVDVNLATGSGVVLPQLSGISEVPLPAAAPLFASVLAGAFGWGASRRRRAARS